MTTDPAHQHHCHICGHTLTDTQSPCPECGNEVIDIAQRLEVAAGKATPAEKKSRRRTEIKRALYLNFPFLVFIALLITIPIYMRLLEWSRPWAESSLVLYGICTYAIGFIAALIACVSVHRKRTNEVLKLYKAEAAEKLKRDGELLESFRGANNDPKANPALER